MRPPLHLGVVAIDKGTSGRQLIQTIALRSANILRSILETNVELNEKLTLESPSTSVANFTLISHISKLVFKLNLFGFIYFLNWNVLQCLIIVFFVSVSSFVAFLTRIPNISFELILTYWTLLLPLSPLSLPTRDARTSSPPPFQPLRTLYTQVDYNVYS